VARVRERYPRVQVTVIGDSNGSVAEEAEKRRIAAVVADRGLADVVTLCGFVPYERFVAAAREHDIFLSPSITARDGDCEAAPLSRSSRWLPVACRWWRATTAISPRSSTTA